MKNKNLIRSIVALAGMALVASHVLAIGSVPILQGISIGSSVVNGTAGSVLFVDANGNTGQDNANLYWDDANNLFGVGTSSPWGQLSVEIGAANPAFVVGDKGSTTPAFIITNNRRVGVGTSSPSLAATFGIASSTATTTLEIGTEQQTTRGSCIQMYSATGTPVRVYVDFNATSTLRAESGACDSAVARP